MKKIISLIIALAMLVSTTAFAVEYGSEWSGYTSADGASFTDVPSDHWAKDNISRVVAKGWFNGYPDGTFHPSDSITREEAMTVFVKFLGLEIKSSDVSSYYDVETDDWAFPYIETGKLLFPKITTYNGENPFQPKMPMTREDTVYALVTALRYTDDTIYADQSVLNMFSDKNSISELIKPYVVVAVNKGLVSGYSDGTIGAQDPLTRAEFATLLYRASYVGMGTSALNLEEEESTVRSIELSPSGTYQMQIGETEDMKAFALMSTGIREEYGITPVTTDSCIELDGTTIKAVSAGTGVIKFLNDALLADKTVTVIVSNPTSSPEFDYVEAPGSVTSDTAVIKGRVSDPSGSALTLDLDGRSVRLSSNEFSTTVDLEVGTNTFVLTLKNSYGVSTVKTVKIKRENTASSSATTAPTTKPTRVPSTPTPEPTATPTPTPTPSPANNDAYVTSFEWSVSSVEMSEGETASIKLFKVYSDGNKEDCTRDYKLSSTDSSVATIDSRGKITAVSGGTARISFSAGVGASVSMPSPLKVTVKASSSRENAVLRSLEWSKNSVRISAGETADIKLYGVYSDGTKVDMTAECGVYAMDDDIAVVNGGTIRGVGKGKTQLWFSSIPSTDISLPDMLNVTVTE
jgi:hypothetical protein